MRFGENWRQTQGKDSETSGRKSHFDRYFEGYTAYRVPKRSGKGTRIVRVYEGVYHVPDPRIPPRGRKLLYGALYLASAGFFLWGIGRPVTSNFASYVAVCEAGALLTLGYLLYLVGCYLLSGDKLTHYDYSSVARPIAGWSLAGAICTGAAALGTLLYMGLSGAGLHWDMMINALLYAASSVSALVLANVEKHTVYTEELSDCRPPENASRV